MPPIEEVQRSLSGAWALMRGKKSGLALLDLSADGFWDSFWAIPLAVPPFLLSWITMADRLALRSGGGENKVSLVTRLALIDIATWLLPILILALVARRIGIAGRFVPFIVASNWATTIIVWIGLPLTLLGFLAPGSGEMVAVLGLAFFVLSMVLFWRLTHATLAKDVSTTITVYVGLNVLSFAIFLGLQALLGIPTTA